ncbi:LamG domain-containing protein [Candidatus Parabeggiatoa sp. HSG14]|uniref:LamG domain-containing protein n=1 Tax=Candidatus Parabeggiatoa sp. HSG14 TaxID=3055593 RepID=UPI0025A89152|nr:LamG domain-containing protein [Thiotrichales bacterium HSG14]
MLKKLLSICLLMPTLVMASGDLCDPKTSTIGDCVKEINKQIKKLEKENQAQQTEIQALKNRWILTDGLVVYYPFNGNANDVSGNGHHGTVNGATLSKDRFENADSAYSFDGSNDKIEIATTSTLQFVNSSFSFVAWAYLEEYGVERDRPLLYKATWSGNGNPITDGYQFWYGWKNDLILSKPEKIHTVVSNALNQWKMLVVTYDVNSQTLRMYADTALEKEVVNSQPIQVTPNSPLYIGYSQNYGGSWFKGKLDELRIYNRALTDVEIKSLYKHR